MIFSQTTISKAPLLLLGAPPRSGNHLLRGLLDNHPQLLLPPDEDYFVRQLSRHVLLRLRGMLAKPYDVLSICRKLQKDGHFERVNSGLGTEVFGSEGSLDLEAYYQYMCQHHKRGKINGLVRNHVEALAVALGHVDGDGRLRVIFSALQSKHRDLSRIARLLARGYNLRGIFLVRDPRAHLASRLVRNPTLDVRRFCQSQNRYWREIEQFSANFGPVMRLRFESLVTDTETCMRRVCDFAEINFLPTVLEYTQGGEPSRSNSSFAASSGIDREVLTRHRNILPQETAAYVQKHCLPQLFWHGSGVGVTTAGAEL